MYLVMVIKNDEPEMIHMGLDWASGEKHFLDACNAHISNWGSYGPGDIGECLDQGYESFGGGRVVLMDLREVPGHVAQIVVAEKIDTVNMG